MGIKSHAIEVSPPSLPQVALLGKDRGQNLADGSEKVPVGSPLVTQCVAPEGGVSPMGGNGDDELRWTMTNLRMWKWAGVAGLVLLAGFAGYLSVNRIYQVDEAQNLFMIRVLGTHQASVYFTNGLLWMLGPLAWAAAGAQDAVSLFFLGRMVFLGIFVVNVWLTAVNVGVPLRSGRGLLALMGAATLAPLWDYGFEVRHDNLILLGLLTMWWLGRTRPRGVGSYIGLGSLAVALVCVAFKAFAYVAPLSLAFLAFPPPGHREGRLRLLGAWAFGCALAGAMILLVYRFTGTGTLFLAGFSSGMHASEGGARFAPSLALVRLLWQTPLLLGLWASSMVILVQRVREQGVAALSWDGWGPESLLGLGGLGLLLVNPTPFPYNLINLIPFVFLVSFRLLAEVMEDPLLPAGRVMIGGLLCFTHLVPFGQDNPSAPGLDERTPGNPDLDSGAPH